MEASAGLEIRDGTTVDPAQEWKRLQEADTGSTSWKGARLQECLKPGSLFGWVLNSIFEAQIQECVFFGGICPVS